MSFFAFSINSVLKIYLWALILVLKKEKAPELRCRKGRIRKVYEIVFGFKIWVVWDPNSRLPIAMRFATIEVNDIKFTQEVIQQAITNLGDHAKITSIAIDRGFMARLAAAVMKTERILYPIPLMPLLFCMTLLRKTILIQRRWLF